MATVSPPSPQVPVPPPRTRRRRVQSPPVTVFSPSVTQPSPMLNSGCRESRHPVTPVERSRRANAGINQRYAQDYITPDALSTSRRRCSSLEMGSPSVLPPPHQRYGTAAQNEVTSNLRNTNSVNCDISLTCGKCKTNPKTVTVQPCRHTFYHPCARQLFGVSGCCCHCHQEILSVISFQLND